MRLLLSSLHKKADINPLFVDWEVNEIRDHGGETAQLLIERGLREKNPVYDF